MPVPVPVKPKEQQPLTTYADGAQKTTVSTKHETSYRVLQPMKSKQQYVNVQSMVTKSVSQQMIPKISQKKPISTDQHRPKMHNQGRHDVLKQPLSSKSARINEKQYNWEFPVSYCLLYCVMVFILYIYSLLKLLQTFHKKK